MTLVGRWCLALGLCLAWTPAYGETALDIRPLPGAKADVAAMLFSGSTGGTLWAAAAALPSEQGVDVSVELYGRSLLEAHDPQTELLKIELYAYALDGSRLMHSLAGRVNVDLAEHGDALTTAGLRLSVNVDVPPGTYDLRLLVRDKGSQRFALRRLSVQAGAKADPPRFEPSPSWLEARTEGFVGEPFSPWPVWVIGRDEPVPAPEKAEPLELVDAEGRRLAECDLRRTGDALRVEGPAVCAGSRLLRPRGGEGWSLPVLILEPEWHEERPSWAQVRELVERPEERARILRAGVETRRSKRIAGLIDAHRLVLGTLAQGRPDEALDRLHGLDAEAFAVIEKGADLVDAQKNAVLKLGKELAGREPEALFPMLWLHLELHDRYVLEQQQDPFMLEAVWVRVRVLAELYGKKAQSDVADTLASGVLAELGIAVDQGGLPRTALRLFKDATEIDPHNGDVWRYLAFWHERRGQVDRSVEALEELLELSPDLDDARLRRAIGLRRLGQDGRALEVLEPLLRKDGDAGVLSVAYQEGARLHMVAGRFDAAVELLDVAVARFPGNQRLHLQLAHALERRPQRSEQDRRRAGRLLDELPPDRGPSARYRYQQPPEDSGVATRLELRRHVNARLPILAAALGTGEQP